MLDQRLPPPPAVDYPNNSMWVDEQIWGHRLWDAQSPWLIFLEFLTVAEACHRQGKLLDDGGRPYPLSFRPHKRMYLRNILYNNEVVFQIAERYRDNETAWREWLAWMGEKAQGVPDRDFAYVKDRFRSFEQFAAVIAMIRSSTIESEAKRWSSRFVFPFGPNAIYEDLNVTGGSISREYIHFGLPGELLYQMLLRSSHADRLKTHLARALNRKDPCDQLLGLLQPDRPDEHQTRGNSYLPFAQHPAFDALAIDWLSIFELELPRYDAYPHLATLAALHLCLYQLGVAADYSGADRPSFICEVVAPRKTLVRELSMMSYLQNNQLPQRAIEAFVRNMGASADWQAAADEPSSFSACRQLMREQARWPNDDDDYDGPADVDALLSAFKRAALARHRQHVANVHRTYGGGSGLVSRRGTNRLRYAPTDELLKALILANVPMRMEYGEFLALLYDRYGFVFGEREAHRALPTEEFDKRAFQANAGRLEVRLRTLGMLRRLSDACAYVENPLRKSAT